MLRQDVGVSDESFGAVSDVYVVLRLIYLARSGSVCFNSSTWETGRKISISDLKLPGLHSKFSSAT